MVSSRRLVVSLCSLMVFVLVAGAQTPGRATSAGGDAAVVAVGTNRAFSHSVDAPVAPAAVWSTWMDVASWPRWDSELRAAELSMPPAVGATGRLQTKDGRWSTFRITALEAGRSYTFVTELPLARLTIRRSLEPSAQGVRFTHEVSFSGLLGRVFASRFGPQFRRALPEAMARLVPVAQAQTRQ